MRTRVVVSACLLLVLLPSRLLARDEVEVHVFQHVDDEPLGTVANRLALLSGVRVEVEESLRERKISLTLGHPLEEALARVAEAAGGHLVRTGPKSFEIRTGVGGDDAPAGELPGWIRELERRLEETEVTVCWTGERITEVLAWLQEQSGVRIRLDPRVLAGRAEEDLAIHIAAYGDDMEPRPMTLCAGRVLDLVLSYPTLDLARAFRFGGVYVSTRERIASLPAVPRPAEGIPKELVERIQAARVSVELERAILARALERIGKLAGVTVEVDREVRRRHRRDRVDLELEDTPLLEALDHLLAPRGLTFEYTDEGLSVRRVSD